MNQAPAINLLRILFVAFTGYLGTLIGDSFWEQPKIGTFGGIAFGLAVVLADLLLLGFSLRLFSSATFGLFIGFIASKLLLDSELLAPLPPGNRWLIGLTVYATFSYIGMMLAIRSNRDEFAMIIPYVRFRQQETQDIPLLVDSNIIIDGRLPELAATGFLSRSFIVPSFVLNELQTLADSHDQLKREKGKLALERLQGMQRNPILNISIHETSLDDKVDVDNRLVHLAKILSARLLTNDSNLCSIARLQGVTVLNLNDLTKVLKPPLSAGDEIDINLSREGRESHQAVGYLEDGTMIVVNQARQHLGKVKTVTISSILQTASGRLFFAELSS